MNLKNMKIGESIIAESDQLPGGLADSLPDSMFNPEQLEKGIKVELKEHTDDSEKAKEIAKDHLIEDPKYYDLLEKMEEQFEATAASPPELNLGDIILAGKFKNKKAIIKGFGKDKNGQPIVKTDKGTYNVFSFRLARLMPTKADLTGE